jgi:lipopolysaccharide cholinephosphotransferase
MPFHGVPEPGIRRNLLCKKIRMIRKLDHKRREPFSDNKRLIGKLLWVLFFPFNRLVKENFWYRVWEKTVSRCKYDEANYTGFTWSNLNKTNMRRLILKKELFQEYVELPFKNITVRCPMGWDAYLTQHFGNYMQLPPKDQREAKHIYIVDLNKSYREYQKMSIDELKKIGGKTE